MAEIVKTFKKPISAARFIGKRYGDEDRVNGNFGAKWEDWFRNGWFGVLKQLGSPEGWDNVIGGVGSRSGVFKYWIGRFTPAGTPVPEGFDCIDYDAGHVGTCRLKGHENDIWGKEVMCFEHLKAEGYEMLSEKEMGKEFTCFERYLDWENGTEEDFSSLEKGYMFLDICFYVK